MIGVGAFLFPGQASQYVGMARDLYEAHSLVRDIFAQADQVLGFSLSQICFSGPEEELRQTAVTQPAVFVHSVAAWRLLVEAGVEAQCAAGHSLGEYSALVAAGALDWEEGLALVKQRSLLMQRAGERQPGSMMAVLGLTDEAIEAICAANGAGIVVPANYNAPGQVVVSGQSAALEALAEEARQAGAKRVIKLEVSGAFHSPLMQEAAQAMGAELAGAKLRRPRIPIITNVSAAPVVDPEELRRQLVEQITSPVRWTESVRSARQVGAVRALEVGPGSVLKGLVRRIERDWDVIPAGTAADIPLAVQALKGDV
ncbi:MAG: ACP S-malonyltransferase [Candidatus Latescibacteria bacterium]|nr:ACP S-malonyltransferase [Candidatus Latescibacterota bacterium]